MISFTTSPQEREYILDTIEKAPHHFYDVVEYTGNGTLTIGMPEQAVALHTSLTTAQIETLKQNVDVAVAFARVGDTLGLRIRTV